MHKFIEINQLFLCSFYRNLAELFEIFHEFKSGFAGACTGSLVSLYELSLCVYLEISDSCIDFFNKLFHFSEI